jgi:hypothetical protein
MPFVFGAPSSNFPAIAPAAMAAATPFMFGVGGSVP